MLDRLELVTSGLDLSQEVIPADDDFGLRRVRVVSEHLRAQEGHRRYDHRRETAHGQSADYVLDAIGDAKHHPVALFYPQVAQSVRELVDLLVKGPVGDLRIAAVVRDAISLLADQISIEEVLGEIDLLGQHETYLRRPDQVGKAPLGQQLRLELFGVLCLHHERPPRSQGTVATATSSCIGSHHERVRAFVPRARRQARTPDLVSFYRTYGLKVSTG